MDYKRIEDLVLEAKAGDFGAKEELANEFRPFIINLSIKSNVHGYDREDLQNECFKTLFKCLSFYDCENHRFVAYATNAIKNNINNLIRTSLKRESAEGPKALIMDEKLESTLKDDNEFFEDRICNLMCSFNIRELMKELSEEEQELLDFVFFKKQSLRAYANLKGRGYTTIVNRKNIALRNLRKLVDKHNNSKGYLN